MAETFGKYQLVRKIAVGGMAEIFLATYTGPEGFKKHVAIKRVLPHLSEDKDFVTMFLDEARLVARFSHPCIVQIFELGKVAENYFLAMEYINGVSMSRIIKESAAKKLPFPFEYGAKVLSQACEGLEYAHNFTDADGTPLNLIHRDVSPHNIMLTYDGVVKVLDFGIAKATGNIYQTRTSSLKGKAAYMSPEQITQRGGIDRRSDVFALGICLFEFTTGKRPFDGDTELELMLSIVQKAPRDPLSVDPNIPQGLVEIIFRALEKDRGRRYQSAREMRGDIEQFLHSRKVLVDSYTLGSFLREVVPPGEHLTGYAAPTPSHPRMPSGDFQEDADPSAASEFDHQKTPLSKVTLRPLTAEDEFPTILTPSDTLRPVVNAVEKQQLKLPVSVPDDDDEYSTRVKAKRMILIAVAFVLVALLGGISAFLAIGDDSETSGGAVNGNPIVTATPDGGEEAKDDPVDAGVAVQASSPADAPSTAEPVDAGPDAGGETKVASLTPPEKKDRGDKRGKGKSRNSKNKSKKTRPGKTDAEAEPLVERKPDKSETRNVEISRVPDTGVQVSKAEEVGTLVVESNPWAEVVIDGSSYGTTPIDKPITLRAGSHQLVLQNPKQGIYHQESVKIVPGAAQSVRKNFRKGLLHVFVMPFGDVYLDGENVGITPLDPIELYEGIHSLQVRCSRTGKSSTDKIRIEAGQTKTIKLDLR